MTGLVFDAAAHTYHLDGMRVPSVTGILHRAGLIDFSCIPPGTLDAARRRGQAVHEAICFYNDGDLDVGQFCADFPSYEGYLAAWITFCEQRRFTAVLSEHRVASRSYRVAGTLDCLGLLDAMPVLLDFKTGNPKDVAADLQTAAYNGLALEWSADDPQLGAFFADHPIVKRYAIQLKADGTFKMEPYVSPADYREFLVLVTAQQIVERRRAA